jgi:hypothetical protein
MVAKSVRYLFSKVGMFLLDSDLTNVFGYFCWVINYGNGSLSLVINVLVCYIRQTVGILILIINEHHIVLDDRSRPTPAGPVRGQYWGHPGVYLKLISLADIMKQFYLKKTYKY